MQSGLGRSSATHGIGGQHLPFPEQHHRDVTQRSQVAARPNAPLFRDPGHDARVEQADQGLHQTRPHATGRTQQHVGPKQHCGTYHVRGQYRTDSRRVAANQVHLKLLELVGRHPHIRKFAEAGVDAVDRLASLHRTVHQTAAGPEARDCGRIESDTNIGCPRDTDHLFHRQILTGELQNWDGHGNNSNPPQACPGRVADCGAGEAAGY